MTVYRRKGSKTYTASFIIKSKRYSFSTREQTKRRAIAVEAAERQKILKNSKLSPEEKGAKALLLDAIEQVYEARWRHTKDSQRSCRRAINLAAITGNIPLSDITETTILHLTKTLESKGSSKSTINRYLAALKTILKHHKQPVDCIKLYREPKGRIRTINIVEEKQIVDLLRSQSRGRRYYFKDCADLVEVLLDSGMRLSECLRIQYLDIDFSTGMISLHETKSGRSRGVPMTGRVRSILERRRLENPFQPFTFKDYQAETAWRWVRKEMGLEGDKQYVIHALRHSFCSRLLSKGVGLHEVQLLMGHASIVTTISTYSHIDQGNLISAIKTLEG